jgi:hypothetical protein
MHETRVVLIGPMDEVALQIGPEVVTFKKGEPRLVSEALQAELLTRAPEQMWSDPDAMSDAHVLEEGKEVDD